MGPLTLTVHASNVESLVVLGVELGPGVGHALAPGVAWNAELDEPGAARFAACLDCLAFAVDDPGFILLHILEDKRMQINIMLQNIVVLIALNRSFGLGLRIREPQTYCQDHNQTEIDC